MQQYHDLIIRILNECSFKDDRTGTGTISVFGHQMRFNLQKGFPIVTGKKVNFLTVVAELLWFISGSTDVNVLKDQGVKIWNEWANEHGNIGPMYGAQWRGFCNGGIDQLLAVIDSIKTIPHSRRHIVSSWYINSLPDENVSPQENVKNGKMALAPCHAFFQFYVNNGKLSCQFYMRSADVFLGLPFNIASYALLTHLVANECGLLVGDLVVSLGDAHLYNNHISLAKQLLSLPTYSLPTLSLNDGFSTGKKVVDVVKSDIKLCNYQSGPYMKAEISI